MGENVCGVSPKLFGENERIRLTHLTENGG